MTRRQELVLAAVGALLVLVAATLLLIRPTRQATAEARADHDAAVAESQTLRDQIKALEALKPKEAELKAQAELAKRHLEQRRKAAAKVMREEEAAAPGEEILLLREIRDSLRQPPLK